MIKDEHGKLTCEASSFIDDFKRANKDIIHQCLDEGFTAEDIYFLIQFGAMQVINQFNKELDN